MAVTKLLLAAQAVVGPDPVYVNGDIGQLSINQDGRLRVSSKPGFFDVVTGGVTAVGNQVATDVTDASNVMVHIKNTGSVAMSAGVLQFEGSLDSTNGTDGTWFAITATRSNSNIVETSTPTLSIAQATGYANAWELSVNACRWFRVRCSTAVTANSIAFVTIVRGTYATEPVPAIQTHPVTGSGTFTVAGTVTASPQSATPTPIVTTATTNANLIKSSGGKLMEITISNLTAATIYVKLYNKASAPTVGTDVPLATIPVVAGGFVCYDFGSVGKQFGLGIALAVTAGAAATDTAAVAAGAQISTTHI